MAFPSKWMLVVADNVSAAAGTGGRVFRGRVPDRIGHCQALTTMFLIGSANSFGGFVAMQRRQKVAG